MNGNIFGVAFVGRSYPIANNHFVQVDPTHWVLDIFTTVTPNFWELKEVVLFLNAPGILDPTLALGLYVKAGNTEWEYRGCVHDGQPSEVMPLQWPELTASNMPAFGPGSVQLGVSVEPKDEALTKEGSKHGARQDFAKRVGMDLFRFLESFHTQRVGDQILIPTNALDRWFVKFGEKFRRDPDFLTRNREQF